MTQVTRFGTTQALMTYRLGYNPADLLQQVDADYEQDLAAQGGTIIEVARQVDVVSPVSDLALGITPVAFGPSPAWTNVANLTDGNDSTTFASGPNYVQGGSAVDKGFSIDLGAPAAVSEMQLKFTPYAPSAYFIESSTDNVSWTDRPYTRTGPVASFYTYTLTGGPITARYWRIRRSYLGYIGPQRVYTWKIAGSTTTSSEKTWFGTTLVNDFDDTTYEPSDGVDEVLRVLFEIDERIARAMLLVGSEFAGSVTYEIQAATELDFSDAFTLDSVTIAATGGYTADEVSFSWEAEAAYSLWQIVSSVDENRRFYTLEMFEAPLNLSAYQLIAEKDQPNGYAGLDSSGKVPVDEIPLVENLETAETDTTKRLAPDGAGGVEWAAGGSGAIDAKEDGSTVVAGATAFDYRTGLNVTAPGGGVAQVDVDPAAIHVEDLGATSTDSTKVYAPDGAGGVIARAETAVSGVLFNTLGEKHVIQAHGNMGATETFDLANGNVHQGTLDASTVITLTGFTNGVRCILEAKVTENGTGGFIPSFVCAGTIVWISGAAPAQDTTAGTVAEYVFWSDDGGTTVYGGILGGGGAEADIPALTLSTSNAAGSSGSFINTDATIALFSTSTPVTQAFGDAAATGSDAHAARLDHRHGMPASPSGTSTPHYLLLSSDHGVPIVFSDILQASDGNDLLYGSE